MSISPLSVAFGFHLPPAESVFRIFSSKVIRYPTITTQSESLRAPRHGYSEPEIGNSGNRHRQMSVDIDLAEHCLHGCHFGCRHWSIRGEVSAHFRKAAYQIRTTQRNQCDWMTRGNEALHKLGIITG